MTKHKKEKKEKVESVAENIVNEATEQRLRKGKFQLVVTLILALIVVYLAYNHNKGLTPEQFDKALTEWQTWKQQEEMSKVAEKIEIKSDDHVYGSEDAEITIFEYSDFECPYCKKFSGTAKEIVDKSGGKINTVFRHFPLSFHDPLATKAAVAAECVAEVKGTDGFYAFHDKYFQTTEAGGNGTTEAEILKIATSIGVDKATFETCINSGKYEQKVQEQIKNGAEAGITGTPGVIIKNNKKGTAIMGAGAEPVESLEAKIETLQK